jgi:hypothetical protein
MWTCTVLPINATRFRCLIIIVKQSKDWLQKDCSSKKYWNCFLLTSNIAVCTSYFCMKTWESHSAELFSVNIWHSIRKESFIYLDSIFLSLKLTSESVSHRIPKYHIFLGCYET